MQPVVNWIAEHVMPVLAPVIEGIGNKFLNMLETISDVFNGLFDILGGVIDFITGVFSGDWEKAWNGIKNIFKGVWETFAAIAKKPINAVIDY